MDTLGDDLILLSIDPESGRTREAYVMKFGLAGSELIRLVTYGLVTISGGRLLVTGSAGSSTGDVELDAALASFADARRPPTPKGWVSKPRRNITPAYLAKLESAGRIHRAPGAGPRARWWIADQTGVVAARARLDAIATGTGPVDLEQAAYGGLVHAVQLDRVYYRGWDNRAVRKRMKQVAQGRWTAPAVDVGAQAAATRAAVAAAIDAAVSAAVVAATAANTG